MYRCHPCQILVRPTRKFASDGDPTFLASEPLSSPLMCCFIFHDILRPSSLFNHLFLFVRRRRPHSFGRLCISGVDFGRSVIAAKEHAAVPSKPLLLVNGRGTENITASINSPPHIRFNEPIRYICLRH